MRDVLSCYKVISNIIRDIYSYLYNRSDILCFCNIKLAPQSKLQLSLSLFQYDQKSVYLSL